jgi:hypothetical protein
MSAAKPPSRPHATTEINARNSSITLRAFSEPSRSSVQRGATSDSFFAGEGRQSRWVLPTHLANCAFLLNPLIKVGSGANALELTFDTRPGERLIRVHFAANLDFDGVVKRAACETLPIADPLDTPANGRAAVCAELIVNFLATLAEAGEGFNRPNELFYVNFLDRHRLRRKPVLRRAATAWPSCELCQLGVAV